MKKVTSGVNPGARSAVPGGAVKKLIFSDMNQGVCHIEERVKVFQLLFFFGSLCFYVFWQFFQCFFLFPPTRSCFVGFFPASVAFVPCLALGLLQPVSACAAFSASVAFVFTTFGLLRLLALYADVE